MLRQMLSLGVLLTIFSSCRGPQIGVNDQYFYRPSTESCFKRSYNFDEIKPVSDWEKINHLECEDVLGVKIDFYSEVLVPILRYRSRLR